MNRWKNPTAKISCYSPFILKGLTFLFGGFVVHSIYLRKYKGISIKKSLMLNGGYFSSRFSLAKFWKHFIKFSKYRKSAITYINHPQLTNLRFTVVMSMFVSSKWQRATLPTRWRASVGERTFLPIFVTYMIQEDEITVEKCAHRGASVRW